MNSRIFILGFMFVFLLSIQGFADLSISPEFVDTGVMNQTIRIIIPSQENITLDEINISILNQTIVNVSSIETNETILTLEDQSNASISIQGNTITIKNNTQELFSLDNNLTIDILVNTNASETNSTINITLKGLNKTNDYSYSQNLTLTTKELITINNIDPIKTTAIVNGTDYWEFQFNLSINENLTGTLYYWMTNWTTSNGDIMSLGDNNCIFNSTYDQINVHNDYEINNGIDLISHEDSYIFTMRMTIPQDSAISSSWTATYYMVFRAEP